MKIEIWFDFVCPYCYIGKKRLAEALALFPHRDQVELVFKSFELDPDKPLYNGENMAAVFAENYGVSLEEAQQVFAKTRRLGEEVGLVFDYDHMKPTNTLDAHRLAHFAQTAGQANELIEKIYFAYFTQSRLISAHETLADLAESAGIDRDAALSVLLDPDRYREDVRLDEAQAYEIYFEVVPHFRFNNKYEISAAPPVETFLEVLQKAWAEEQAAGKTES